MVSGQAENSLARRSGKRVMTQHAVNAVGGEALLDLGLFDHGEQRLL